MSRQEPRHRTRDGSCARAAAACRMLRKRAEVVMASKDEEELVKLERQYWQALKDRDYDTALRLTDDPVIVVGAQGVGKMDKESIVAMMQNAPDKLEAFELGDDIKVQMLGDDVAVVAYKAHEELTVNGE